ncbi:hypothetical protein H2198_002745 [Neophaeococcomyces mojaviensis]|uniref:Uncharacterized protein n=1 Tax=Neophaeococcomyces mojaviensis TaxID=3383035 RepID=A0ACC3ADC8_9EURO|nr:hypothetical protein H2198_002745 [Knufia sp. JES_112]
MSSNKNDQNQDASGEHGDRPARGRENTSNQDSRIVLAMQNPFSGLVYSSSNPNTQGLQPPSFPYINPNTGLGTAQDISAERTNSMLNPLATSFSPLNFATPIFNNAPLLQPSQTTFAQPVPTGQAATKQNPSTNKSQSHVSSGRRTKLALTAQQTLDKGAIEMPKNGVKPLGKKCLTCIAQNGGCPGTSVVDGKCQSCRGIGVSEGKTRNKRMCLWLDAKNGVNTYKQAQAFNDSIVNIRNTNWFKALPDDQKEDALVAAAQAKLNEDSEDEAEVESDDNLMRNTIFDLPYDNQGRPCREYMLVTEIARRVIDGIGNNAIENRDIMLGEAYRQQQSVMFGATTADANTRIQARDAYSTVIARLQNTIGVTKEDVKSFLPAGQRSMYG